MRRYHHSFIIPVMGTGHSIDTPIRVAPFGISSVISLVDDMLLEHIRRHYCEVFGLPYTSIPRNADNGRARRITAYLDTVREIVEIKFNEIRRQPFLSGTDKDRYFQMLPDASPLRKAYDRLCRMRPGPERDEQAGVLTDQMEPGSIDVNIMVKLDRTNFDMFGQPLSDDFNDDRAALRGYAESSVESGIVFSAGINRGLYNYIANFRDFYRDKAGDIKKRIILKVSDFRSALIQGKFLARNGLEVSEYRVESGLNCGGHAFASTGYLLPSLLEEFREKRDQLVKELRPTILKFYKSMGWEYPEAAMESQPVLTVQGGIGTYGEAQRLHETFGVDLTGWGSPFLLVPEATCVDDDTRDLIRLAGKDDLYLSDSSPLGVPFNNLRNTGSEREKHRRIAQGKPGSPCPKGHAVTSKEFTEHAICTASRQYQDLKLKQIDLLDQPESLKAQLREKAMEPACICHQLGNGALIALGIVQQKHAPQAICPGPNIRWFDRLYSLQEMVDHIYGRGEPLTPSERPHMFVNELEVYVDFFKRLIERFDGTPSQAAYIATFRDQVLQGADACLRYASEEPFPGENLASIPAVVEEQLARMDRLVKDLEQRLGQLTVEQGAAA